MWKETVEQLRIRLFEYLTVFFEDTGRPRLFSFCRGELFVSFVSRFAGLFRVPRILFPSRISYSASRTLLCLSRPSTDHYLPLQILSSVFVPFLNREQRLLPHEKSTFEARDSRFPDLRPRIDTRDVFPLIRSIVRRRLDNEITK